MVEYGIIEHKNAVSLAGAVNEAIRGGWAPLGGAGAVNTHGAYAPPIMIFFQALTRELPETKTAHPDG